MLAFPLQVFTGSNIPVLFPYLILGLIFIYDIVAFDDFKVRLSFRPQTTLFLFVVLYILIITPSIIFEYGFVDPSLIDLISSLVIYIFPSIFYFYFRKKASENSIRTFIYGLLFASLIVAVFFIFDTYVKFVLLDVTEYAKMSFQYSLDKVNEVRENVNDTRVRVRDRSFGLLESHSISGAWVAIGAFICLSLEAIRKVINPMVIIVFFGFFLLIGMNFTAIVAFIVLVVMFQFRLIIFIFGKIPKLTRSLIVLIFSFILIGIIFFNSIDENLSYWILYFIEMQFRFLFGLEGASVTQGALLEPKIKGLVDSFFSFNIIYYLPSIRPEFKGGDTGVIDTILTFGYFFYLLFLSGLLVFILNSLSFLRRGNKLIDVSNNNLEYVVFSTYVLSLIIIADLHYSIWSAKSILPLIFFCLAINERGRRVVMPPS